MNYMQEFDTIGVLFYVNGIEVDVYCNHSSGLLLFKDVIFGSLFEIPFCERCESISNHYPSVIIFERVTTPDWVPTLHELYDL